jgi:hypothetical protein
LVSLETLKAIVRYDPDTGNFYWLIRASRRTHIGQIAGSLNGKGYWQVEILGVNYQAHRLAWFFVTGEWPAQQIDHVNCISSDNRWSNLRLATSSENSRNSRKMATNKSGFKGVSFHKSTQRWRAVILLNGKHKHLGSRATPEEAHALYVEAARKHFGEFARIA